MYYILRDEERDLTHNRRNRIRQLEREEESSEQCNQHFYAVPYTVIMLLLCRQIRSSGVGSASRSTCRVDRRLLTTWWPHDATSK